MKNSTTPNRTEAVVESVLCRNPALTRLGLRHQIVAANVGSIKVCSLGPIDGVRVTHKGRDGGKSDWFIPSSNIVEIKLAL